MWAVFCSYPQNWPNYYRGCQHFSHGHHHLVGILILNDMQQTLHTQLCARHNASHNSNVARQRLSWQELQQHSGFTFKTSLGLWVAEPRLQKMFSVTSVAKISCNAPKEELTSYSRQKEIWKQMWFVSLPILKSSCCLTSTAADMSASGATRLLHALATDLK